MTFRRGESSELVIQNLSDAFAVEFGISSRREIRGSYARFQLVHDEPNLRTFDMPVRQAQLDNNGNFINFFSVPKHALPAVHEGIVLAQHGEDFVARLDLARTYSNEFLSSSRDLAADLLGKIKIIEVLFPELQPEFQRSVENIKVNWPSKINIPA